MILNIYQKGQQKPTVHEYKNKQHQIVIGRNPKDQHKQLLIVDEPTASRKHLQIKLKNKQLRIRDLDSSNGTKLNSIKLNPNQWVSLTNGDQIVLGQSQTKIIVNLKEFEQKSSSQVSKSSSDSAHERSRNKNKKQDHGFEVLCKELKISNSTIKSIKDMMICKKSKEQIIKFLKLMGCKNVQSHWDELERHLKSTNKLLEFKQKRNNQKAKQQLQKQFQLGRGHSERRGLGR